MDFFSIITEPAIIIITTIFLFFIIYVLSSYNKVEKNLKKVYGFIHSVEKNELSYKFKHIDEFMINNTYTNTTWESFKKALIFPEKLYVANLSSKNLDNRAGEIYLTIDSSYFFNESSLVYSKINNKFIQAMPTLLTGLGPFFTFLKMALAFATVNFAANATNNSLETLMHGIQVAALCSVFAVGYSLLFLLVEKLLYGKKCKKFCLLIEKEFIKLFDVCSSEQFLLDLVKESRIQNVSSEKILKTLPEDIAKSLSKSIGEITTPYLENILYSLNKLNESIDKKSGDDVIDKLF